MEWKYIIIRYINCLDLLKNDESAFIFTLKNPHGLKPMRFNNIKDRYRAINCDPKLGPVFGSGQIKDDDIFINDHCNQEDSCYIGSNTNGGYECDPILQASLFVNTNQPKKRNLFTVLDYEVFIIDYQSEYTVYHMCKYPDIIWEYIQTNDISNESLSQIYEDKEGLLNDLIFIRSNNERIRVKIISFIKIPSVLLPDTQIVEEKYDKYLKEWIGDYQWKLIYRESEHKHHASSFHSYCDGKAPTLIIIKSSEGWVFGGYTTQSWRSYNYDHSIYYHYCHYIFRE